MFRLTQSDNSPGFDRNPDAWSVRFNPVRGSERLASSVHEEAPAIPTNLRETDTRSESDESEESTDIDDQSLAQFLFELAPCRNWEGRWSRLNPEQRAWWEAYANDVRVRVLREQRTRPDSSS